MSACHWSAYGQWPARGRGLLVELTPADLQRVLKPVLVDAATDPADRDPP